MTYSVCLSMAYSVCHAGMQCMPCFYRIISEMLPEIHTVRLHFLVVYFGVSVHHL